MRSPKARIAAGLLAGACLATPALPHGALIEVAEARAVTILARYDTGEAMVGAQVAVFSPGSGALPWSTGVTDAEGRFTFVPDGQAGQWAVQARQAGHGAMAHLIWSPEQTPVALAVQGGATGPLQRLLMAACVIWGCLGTALYFLRPMRRGAD